MSNKRSWFENNTLLREDMGGDYGSKEIFKQFGVAIYNAKDYGMTRQEVADIFKESIDYYYPSDLSLSDETPTQKATREYDKKFLKATTQF